MGDKLAPVTVKLIANVRRFLKYVFVAMYRAGVKIPWPIPKNIQLLLTCYRKFVIVQ